MSTSELKVSTPLIITQGITGILVFLFPFVLWFVWKKKTNADLISLIAGIIGYLVIGFVRGISRVIFLSGMKDSPWAYYIFQAIFAGIFEEVGRYLIFRYAIPNKDKYRDSVSYGIGHGGLEYVIVNQVSAMFLFNFVMGFLYKTQGIEAIVKYGISADDAVQSLTRIAEIGFTQTIVTMLAYFSSMAFHISMSVLVFTSFHHSFDYKWLFAAIGLHTLIDIIPAFHFAGSLSQTEADIIQIIFTIAVVYFVYRVYEQYKTESMTYS